MYKEATCQTKQFGTKYATDEIVVPKKLYYLYDKLFRLQHLNVKKCFENYQIYHACYDYFRNKNIEIKIKNCILIMCMRQIKTRKY